MSGMYELINMPTRAQESEKKINTMVENKFHQNVWKNR